MSEIDFMMDHVVPRLKKILKNNEILIAEFSTDPTNYIILQKILETSLLNIGLMLFVEVLLLFIKEMKIKILKTLGMLILI